MEKDNGFILVIFGSVAKIIIPSGKLACYFQFLSFTHGKSSENDL